MTAPYLNHYDYIGGLNTNSPILRSEIKEHTRVDREIPFTRVLTFNVSSCFRRYEEVYTYALPGGTFRTKVSGKVSTPARQEVLRVYGHIGCGSISTLLSLASIGSVCTLPYKYRLNE